MGADLSTQNASAVAFAVHDPSHRRDGSYWQWSSRGVDKAWDSVASCVHAGWPSVRGTIESEATDLFGVMETGRDGYWLYRIYPAGRDSHGRPGRYFAVIVQLAEPRHCLDPSVSGVLDYFFRERNLPLNCAALSQRLPVGEPTATLCRVYAEWEKGVNGPHWGMDGSGAIRRFASSPRDASVSPERSMHVVGHDASGRVAESNKAIHRKRPNTFWMSYLMVGAMGFACGGVVGYQIGRSRADRPEVVTVAGEVESRAVDSGQAAAATQSSEREPSRPSATSASDGEESTLPSVK